MEDPATSEPPALDRADVAAYLRRLGLTAEDVSSPDEHSLRLLHRVHLRSVPFENLDIHLGRQIRLGYNRLARKVLDGNRGGFCYELNGLFGSLLAALGYTVDLLEARTTGGAEDGPPFDHMCLRVQLAEPWLVDVGFGDHHDEPLRLDHTDDQPDPTGVYRLAAVEQDLLLHRDGQPQLRILPAPRALRHFAARSAHHQTHPDSHFRRAPVISRRTPTGRLTVSGRTRIETVDGEATRASLDRPTFEEVLRGDFGVALPPVAVGALWDAGRTRDGFTG